MRDVNGDGRDEYCRIIRYPNTRLWAAMCAPAGGLGFGAREIEDPRPPAAAAQMLWWLQGALLWYPLVRGLAEVVDGGTMVASKGTLLPDPDITDGLELNGVDNYLTMPTAVSLAPVRAIAFWARPREFKNNMRVFDFGAGEGVDNTIVGTEGTTNNLLVEFWHARRRAMRIRVQDFFPTDAWTHVAIVADSERSTRPSWTIYRNGQAQHYEPDAWTPSPAATQRNYIGRSNTATDAYWAGNIKDLRF